MYMDGVNGRGVYKSQVGTALTVRRVEESDLVDAQKIDSKTGNGEEKISSLAKQLSAAAERAALRDSQLSRSELADLAASILDRLGGLSYSLAKDFYDSQLPDTDNAELLARARQANDFASGKGSNPFKGFSREQLSLIIYDESGAFTVSERRAAMFEKTDQHNQWAQSISGKMNAEYQRTGRIDEGLHEILDFYNALPPIEVAEYGNYEADIMMQLSQHEVPQPEFDTSLIDMLAKEWKSARSDQAKALDSQSDAAFQGENGGGKA
jgi:hypothetical protein